jgi:hypothetical protein
MAVSANLTKVDAGGSGSNYVADGYIKTVEKVWIDTYTYSAANTIGTGLVIEVAQIPAGKKITGIEVYGIDELSATSTNALSIGTKIASGVTHATLFLPATTFGAAALFGSLKIGPLKAIDNIPYELTGGTNRIFLQFLAANPSITAGTITTIVRYT